MYIVGGRILTMAGREIPEGILQIRNGKIAQVGARGEVKLQPEEGEQVVIAKNALIMPGIIEAHCHMGIMEEKKSTEGDDCNETVDPLTPALRAIDGINPMDAAFDDAVRAGITAAMIGPGSSNVVGGQFAMVKTKGRRIDDLILKSPAAMKVAFGENPKVNYSGQNKSPVTRMAIAAMLRRELWESREYLRQKQEAAEKGEYFAPDFEKECYLPVLRGDIPLKAHVHRVDDIFTAIRIAKEFGIKMTMDHCSEGHLVAEELAKEGFPAIVGPDLTSRNKIEVQNMSFKTAGVLNRAGVTDPDTAVVCRTCGKSGTSNGGRFPGHHHLSCENLWRGRPHWQPGSGERCRHYHFRRKSYGNFHTNPLYYYQRGDRVL